MNILLKLAFLFFIGSVFGWVLELFFRKFFSRNNPEHKWINPGFCVGPYVPLYGFGLCILYLLAYIAEVTGTDQTITGKLLMFLSMVVGMTLIEYIAGIILLKGMNLRLWDYSDQWGNIQGLICPLFSLFWGILGAVYYFLVHPKILMGLDWLAHNLAFSFFIGFFFGVFVLDVVYSAHLVAKLKAFADENDLVVRYESLKLKMHEAREKAMLRPRFFLPFVTTNKPLREYLTDYLNEAKEAVESIQSKAADQMKRAGAFQSKTAERIRKVTKRK